MHLQIQIKWLEKTNRCLYTSSRPIGKFRNFKTWTTYISIDFILKPQFEIALHVLLNPKHLFDSVCFIFNISSHANADSNRFGSPWQQISEVWRHEVKRLADYGGRLGFSKVMNQSQWQRKTIDVYPKGGNLFHSCIGSYIGYIDTFRWVWSSKGRVRSAWVQQRYVSWECVQKQTCLTKTGIPDMHFHWHLVTPVCLIVIIVWK